MLTRRVAGALALLLLLTAGCSGRAASTSKDTTTSTASTNRTEEIPVTLSVEFDGDLRGKAENQTVRTQLVDLTSAKERMFGIETLDPISAGPVAFIVGFVLRPYVGPKEYTIREGAIQDAGGSDAERSSIRVVWFAQGGGQPTADYYRRDQPCRVQVDDDGRKGELTCPRVTNDARDTHFSVHMRWQFAAAS